MKDQLDLVLTGLVDAETGERGFIITGQETYLEPYYQAIATIDPTINRARALASDDATERADLDRVASQATIKLTELADAIRLRRESGFAAAQAVVVTNVGKRTMDGIRAVVARMETREDALLAERTMEAARAYRTARATAGVSTIVGLSIVTALFFVTRHVGVERRRAVNLAERLRVTLSSIGDAVIATDESGRVTHVNPVAEKLTGWSQTDAVGKPLHAIFVIINEESRKPVENPIETVLRDRVIVGLANHTVLVPKNGPEIPVDDSAAPIKTADGRLAGAVLVFRDVTQRRQAERERLGLISELEAAVRSRDDFLSIASHELRNPVNAVQLQVAGLLRALERDDETVTRDGLRNRVARTSGQVARLTRLLDNLLDVSRMTAGSIAFEPEDVDLSAVVREVIDQLRDDPAAGQIILHAVAPVVGYWDPLRLEQVVANLLSNAVKYGNGKPIEVSLTRQDGTARLVVTDHGIGIPRDQQQRLFGRFERGVSGRQYGGFGLGLWITRQIVEAMHGQISVDSESGQGSTFSVSLPMRSR